MQELIKIEVNEQQEIVVSARELHKALEVKKKFTDWWKQQKGYEFEENQDYVGFTSRCRANQYGGEQEVQDYAMKLDMAKEIAMVSKTEKGKGVRRYFIQVEKNWNNPKKVLERANRTLEFELEQLGIASKKLQLSKAEKITCAISLLEKYNSPIAEYLVTILPSTQKSIAKITDTKSATEFIELISPEGELVEEYWEKYSSYCHKSGERTLGKYEFGSAIRGLGYRNKPKYIRGLKETKRIWERRC